MSANATVTTQEISDGLAALGLPAGAQVLLHSSLRSLGHVTGGAEGVIDAFLHVLGPGGTLLVPTLTGSEELSPANPPRFDPLTQPCWTGLIPETLRRRPGAVRSLHPTHSAAALGADAVALTHDHARSVTPCDELSPYGKLAALRTGYIVLLGVTHESNTTFHHVEELAGAPYHMQAGFAAATVVLGEERVTRHVLLHQYGTARNFGVMEPLLVEQGIQRTGQIGAATVRMIHAGEMARATLAALRANPRILCADPT